MPTALSQHELTSVVLGSCACPFAGLWSSHKRLCGMFAILQDQHKGLTPAHREGGTALSHVLIQPDIYNTIRKLGVVQITTSDTRPSRYAFPMLQAALETTVSFKNCLLCSIGRGGAYITLKPTWDSKNNCGIASMLALLPKIKDTAAQESRNISAL